MVSLLPTSTARCLAASCLLWSLGLLIADPAQAVQSPEAAAPPEAAASQWRQASEAQRQPADPAVMAHWWQGFDDADLNQLIRLALTRNTDLQLARTSLAQVRAARDAVAAGASPQLGVGATATRQHAQQSNASTFKSALNGSWSLDLNGAQAAGLAAADAEAQASAEDLLAAQVSLCAELGKTYLQWRGAQARARLTERELESLLQTQRLTAWRVEAGLASDTDLALATLVSEQTRAGLASLQTEVAQLAHLMSLLTGHAPAADEPRMAPEADLPGNDKLIDALQIGLPADLLRRRPDLRAAEADLRAEWARLDQTRRAGRPTLNLTGAIGWQAASLAALGGPGSALASLAASIEGTLWDGGERQSLIAGQQAAYEAARIRYQAVLLKAQRQVEDALVALRNERQRSQALAQAVGAAQAVLQASLQRHGAGLIDGRSLLEAQRDHLSAQLSWQASRTSLAVDLVQLFEALGGGWSADDAARAYTPETTASER